MSPEGYCDCRRRRKRRPTARCHSDKDADTQRHRDSNERTLFSFLRDLAQGCGPVPGRIFAESRRLLAERVCALAKAIRPARQSRRNGFAQTVSGIASVR